MSHISEGFLHAHLDGAVGHDRAEEWLLAEAHLSVCEDCRRLLDEARRLRVAAGEILTVATAPSARKPDFQELVAQAGNGASLPQRNSWWNSTSRLAWAASLMLAVGAGWLGRELLIQTGEDMPTVVAETEAIPQAPEQSSGLRDAVEQDEAAADQGRGLAEVEDDEPEVAMMQKSERQKAAEEFRQDDVSRDASVDRLQAVSEPVGERGALARLVGDGATFPACFVSEEDLDAVPLGAPQELQLFADGTAVAGAGESQMTGTWLDVSGDTVQVLLASGEVDLEMRLERTGNGLVGTAVSSARAGALNEVDPAGTGRTVSIRLQQTECEATP